jgi:hypothetical protein
MIRDIPTVLDSTAHSFVSIANLGQRMAGLLNGGSMSGERIAATLD